METARRKFAEVRNSSREVVESKEQRVREVMSVRESEALASASSRYSKRLMALGSS